MSENYNSSMITKLSVDDIEEVVEFVGFPQEKSNLSNDGERQNYAAKASRAADTIYNLIEKNIELEKKNMTENFATYLSLSAFVCELYMKALIAFENINLNVIYDTKTNTIRKTHKLNELFDALSSTIQFECKKIDPNFDEDIVKCADYFMIFRYECELNQYKVEKLPFDLAEKLNEILSRYDKTTSMEVHIHDEIAQFLPTKND